MARSLFLLLTLCFLSPSFAQDNPPPEEVNIYVALDGHDGNQGVIESPKATLEGALKTLRDFRDEGMITPQLPVNVWIRGGTYRIKNTVRLGRKEKGAAKSPFRIRAHPKETVIFDSGLPISADLLKLVDDPKDLARLPEVARGKVLKAEISDARTIAQLSKYGAQISYASRMLTPARFPNIGFSTFGQVVQSDTPKEKGSLEDPKGAAVKLSPASKQNWTAALAKAPQARLVGYMSADWFKATQQVVTLNNSNTLKMVDGSSYGIRAGRRIGRVYLEYILCELDSPGEWFFDPAEKALYLWPTGQLKKDETISVWAGDTNIEVKGSEYLTIENIIFQNLQSAEHGSGFINIRSGNHIEMLGCTFRNMAGASNAFNIQGTSNGARSCNVYDFGFASRLSGGVLKRDEIKPGKNFIENCHFTQIFSKSFYGKVAGISGAGNLFKNNLAHNLNGQIVTISGVDHQIELNEVFNTGVEEGDGGCFYQGHMAHSWGNVFQHNFIHHLICNPKMYARAAIFSDDGDMGDSVIGNVFYKAGEGFKINGGSGHYAAHNHMIAGIHGIFAHPGKPKENYKKLVSYLGGDPSSSDKANLIGRGMKVFGRKNWMEDISPDNWPEMLDPYWAAKYPKLQEIFDHWHRKKADEKLNVFEDNVFYGFSGEALRVPKTTTKRRNRTKGRISGFVDVKTLNFARKSGGLADRIPFGKIGLYKDAYRPSPPVKDAYRKQIGDHWKNDASAGGRNYVPTAVNKRIYLNTGLLLIRLTNPEFAPDLKLSPREK